jgi:hypothetical protein
MKKSTLRRKGCSEQALLYRRQQANALIGRMVSAQAVERIRTAISDATHSMSDNVLNVRYLNVAV